jgi:hypothetical protein
MREARNSVDAVIIDFDSVAPGVSGRKHRNDCFIDRCFWRTSVIGTIFIGGLPGVGSRDLEFHLEPAQLVTAGHVTE